MNKNKYIKYTDKTGKDYLLRNNFVNNLLVNGEYYYDSELDQANFHVDWCCGSVGSTYCVVGFHREAKSLNLLNTVDLIDNHIGCEFELINSNRDKIVTFRGFNINLAKLYIVIKNISNGINKIEDIDNLVINHMDNNAYFEGGKNNGVLKTYNYELVTNRENSNHARVWFRLLHNFGIFTRFSARDFKFINAVDRSIDLNSLRINCNNINIDLDNYIITEQEWIYAGEDNRLPVIF